MVLLEQPSKILVLTKTGEVPTIFNGVRNRRTDIEIGQRVFNNVDNIYFTRIANKIVQISPAKHRLNDPLFHLPNSPVAIPTGNLMDADGNGLPNDSGITAASVIALINALTLPPETYYSTAGQTTFPTTGTPTAGTLVFIDGQLQTMNWGIVAGVITFNVPVLEGQKIDVVFR